MGPTARITLAFLVTRGLLLLATIVPWPLGPCLRYEVSGAAGAPPVEVVIPWRIDARGERDYLPGDPPPVLDAFARMDSEYYLAIAAFGYRRDPDGSLPQRAGFFPGYPATIRGLTHVVNALRGRPGAPVLDAPMMMLLAAFLISNATLWAAALALHRLAILFFEPRVAEDSALWLLCCPVAFFGSAYLAESLFLFFSIAAVLSAFQRRMAIAVLLGAAAAFTRPVGALLVIPLLWISWQRRAERRSVARDALLVLLFVPAGAAAVLLWHRTTLGDPWAYLAIQREYGHGGFPDFVGVVDLFRVAGKNTLERVRDTVQIAALGAAVACIAALVRSRKAPSPLWVWAAVLVLFVLLSGHLISIPRYLFSAFPLFLGAALLFSGSRSGRATLAVSVAAQVAGFVVFMRAWPVFI